MQLSKCTEKQKNEQNDTLSGLQNCLYVLIYTHKNKNASSNYLKKEEYP